MKKVSLVENSHGFGENADVSEVLAIVTQEGDEEHEKSIADGLIELWAECLPRRPACTIA